MPTGHMLTQAEWETVARVCIKTDAWFLYDAAIKQFPREGIVMSGFHFFCMFI
jgi:aspartate/methionine/tyrosine aminotransferase